MTHPEIIKAEKYGAGPPPTEEEKAECEDNCYQLHEFLRKQKEDEED